VSRSRIRILVLFTIGFSILGLVLIAGSLGYVVNIDYYTRENPTSPDIFYGNLTLTAAIIVSLTAIILYLIAWFNALIKTARIQQMGWFTLILLLGIIPLFIYALVGPETPNKPTVIYAPPGYPPYGYPPQQGYPPSANPPPPQSQ
jgi:hypothetical protein